MSSASRPNLQSVIDQACELPAADQNELVRALVGADPVDDVDQISEAAAEA